MPNWAQVLEEMRALDAELSHSATNAVDEVRKKHLKKLNDVTGRNVIAYYSGWLTSPASYGVDVNDEDKAAFMMAIHGLDKARGLDLILHTPGGGIAAAESLVDYLRRVFGNNIRAIVPHMAMSAGTMIACSCKSVVMGKQSNLGPIDPQLRGLPAAAVQKEVQRGLAEIAEDPNKINFWQFVFSKYDPTFIGQCDQAVKMAREFVKSRLIENMLADEADREEIADRIVDGLSDIDDNKSHDRHIHIDRCKLLGLRIEELEEDQDLQDAVLTVHHCFMHSLQLTSAVKIVENHQSPAFIKMPG